MAKPKSDADKKVKELETLLAKNRAILAEKIGKIAELLKENVNLQKELEKAKIQINNLKRKRLKGKSKTPCNREKAMVVYGEIDSPEMPD